MRAHISLRCTQCLLNFLFENEKAFPGNDIILYGLVYKAENIYIYIARFHLETYSLKYSFLGIIFVHNIHLEHVYKDVKM